MRLGILLFVLALFLGIFFYLQRGVGEKGKQELSTEVLLEKVAPEEKLFKEASLAEKGGQTAVAYDLYRDFLMKYPHSEHISYIYLFLASYYRGKGLDKQALVEVNKVFDIAEDLIKREDLYKAYLFKAQLISPKEPQKAVHIYRSLVENFFEYADVEEVTQKLQDLSWGLVFSLNIDDYSEYYHVQEGDNLSSIGDRFNTSVDYLIYVNHITESAVLRVRDGLKVFHKSLTVRVEIVKSLSKLMLYFNNNLIKTFPVALGEHESTPIGTFQVQNKLKKPCMVSQW